MGKFIFVRHGQSQANADGIIADAHSALTENGIEQARKTAEEIRGFNITTIACSPYLRAQQTAETIAGELGIELGQITIIDNLRERGLGDCEGRPKQQPSEWYSMEDAPTLESRQDLLNRMNAAISEVARLEDNGIVLVVGHAISGFFLVEAANGAKTATDISLDNQIGNADFVEVNY